MTSTPIIVSVSGITGSGKSSISELARDMLKDATVIEFDSFETLTRNDMSIVLRWLKEPGLFEQQSLPNLHKSLKNLRERKPAGLPTGETLLPASIIFFETPLGRTHAETSPLIDLSIWLDCPLDIALARNIAHWTKDAQTRPAQFQSWLANYLDAYLSTLRQVAKHQEALVRKTADIVLNNDQDKEKCAKGHS